MPATRVTSFWTAVLDVLVRLLAVAGIRVPGRARAAAAVPAPSAAAAGAVGRIPAQTSAATAPGGPPGTPWRVVAPRRPTARERSLPPTIKQRIHAEAHGSSPSVRRIAVPGPGWWTGGGEAADPL